MFRGGLPPLRVSGAIPQGCAFNPLVYAGWDGSPTLPRITRIMEGLIFFANLVMLFTSYASIAAIISVVSRDPLEFNEAFLLAPCMGCFWLLSIVVPFLVSLLVVTVLGAVGSRQLGMLLGIVVAIPLMAGPFWLHGIVYRALYGTNFWLGASMVFLLPICSGFTAMVVGIPFGIILHLSGHR